MLATTLLLLVIGAILASIGAAGFTIAIHQPASDDELRCARKTATAGRWMTVPGLCLYAGHYSASGIGLYALMLVVAVTMASYITKSTTRPTSRA